MLRLKPDPDNFFVCPECQAKNPRINEFIVGSINIFANCSCSACDLEFAQIMPVGHSVDYPLSFGVNNKNIYKSTDCPDWLYLSVLKSHSEIRDEHVSIEKIVYKQYDRVVILNTLDTLYGHVLLKLYNAVHHLNQDKQVGLILIIPAIFKWLIPAGCAEAWIVDLKLSDLIYSYPVLHKFVSDQFPRFKEVYLSKAFSHPEIHKGDFVHFTGLLPFNLDNYYNQKPTITFILREDRWWFKTPLDYWFYRICRWLNVLSFGTRILTWRQNQLVKKTIKAIKRKLPESDFHIIGLGKRSNDGYANDDRSVRTNSEIEKKWCRIYAMSHIVIGVHGSNMLLPSALAAGCIEILPEDRFGNIVQDISVRYNNRLQLFFYRFSDQFSKPNTIANKAIAMINDYKVFNKNMVINTYTI